MNVWDKSLELHENRKGKIEVVSKVGILNRESLSLAYTPGVAAPCRRIAEDPSLVYRYTSKGNFVAVVTDGTAVLGLGNIGPRASLPVMEGKAVLFKEFAGIDAVPICIDSTDPKEIIRTVCLIAPSFGGINLEDIAAPRCFEIEEELKKRLDIPVFHDDQHGTAIVTLAGIMNALKFTGKKMHQCRFVIAGAGAAGIATAKLLNRTGVKDVILVNRNGIVTRKQPQKNSVLEQVAAETNKDERSGQLKDAFTDSDVFIGLAGANMVTESMVASMNDSPVVFAMANPDPEIMPESAKNAGAVVVGTGRSDFPNQINNVLAFPGVFRGVMDVRASVINDDMKIAAAEAIAGIITEKELKAEYVIPDVFNQLVVKRVASAVAQKAIETGAANQ